MATCADLLIQLNHNLVRAHSKTRLRPPKFITRPGVEAHTPGTKHYRGDPVPLPRLQAMRDRWRRGKKEATTDG